MKKFKIIKKIYKKFNLNQKFKNQNNRHKNLKISLKRFKIKN